jgi:hypothetical protein
MRHALRALRHRVGRRGAALLCFSVLDLVYGYAMLFPSPPGKVPGTVQRWFDSIVGLEVWGWLWILIGLWVGWFAFQQQDRFGFSAAIGIKIWWGILCFIGWIMREVPVSSAGIWLGLAVLVALIAGWPEPEPTPEPVANPEPEAEPLSDDGGGNAH